MELKVNPKGLVLEMIEGYNRLLTVVRAGDDLGSIAELNVVEYLLKSRLPEV